MIIERIPDITKLTPEEKAILAEELWDDAGVNNLQVPVPGEHLKLVEERMQHYKEHPETASTWEAVRARVSGKSDS